MQLKCSIHDIYISPKHTESQKKKKRHVPFSWQKKKKVHMAWLPASFKRENYHCTFSVSTDIRATFMRFRFSGCETIADSCQMKIIPLLGRRHTCHLSCPDGCGPGRQHLKSFLKMSWAFLLFWSNGEKLTYLFLHVSVTFAFPSNFCWWHC